MTIFDALGGDMNPQNMNILISRGRRQYDTEPPICVTLRYCYNPVWCRVVADFRSVCDPAALNRIGMMGAYRDVTSAAAVSAIIAEIRNALGVNLPVQVNAHDSDFDGPLRF